MSIKSIHDQLNTLGYFVKLLENDWVSVGKITEPLEGYQGIFQMDPYCDVSHEEGGIYLISYGNKNVQPTIEFSSETEVINWIKRQYPLH